MIRRLASGALPLLALPAVAAAGEPPPFGSEQTFGSTSECVLHLDILAGEARGQRLDAVKGPYEVSPGDLRIHTVQAEGSGHLIHEHRCEESRFSSRSWTHSLEGSEEEFTVESVVRRAPLLATAAGDKDR
jgi:hypothetical protein